MWLNHGLEYQTGPYSVPILPALVTQFQTLFPATRSGQGHARCFILTLQAILVPRTASRTSNLRRAIATLFVVTIARSRYYTFMASVKLPWVRFWEMLWRAIPSPVSDGRLLLAVDDSINAKSGRKAFACQRSFEPYPGLLTRDPCETIKLALGRLGHVTQYSDHRHCQGRIRACRAIAAPS
jgi:hypothetical protein